MDPILDKARAGQNVLERIANAIPGFKGYREKELRRDADSLQREHVARRLDEAKRALNQIGQEATRGGGLEALNDVETARKRLDKVIARIRFADRGYAGFFDTVKVDESVLARVYEFDLSLVEGADRVVTAAATGTGSPAERARAITDEVDALDARLGEREQILGGVR